MKKPSGLSPSSLDLWEQCHRRYKFEKILGRSGGSTVDTVLGTYVHEVLELLMQLPEPLRTTESARRLARQIWPKYQEEEKEIVAPTEDAALAFRRRAWGSVRTYFTIEPPSGVDVVATEQKLDAVIAGVPVRGIIDRIDRDAQGKIVVTDYKAGKVPIKRFRAPKFRQLRIYGLLLEASEIGTPHLGRLVYTSFGEVIPVSITERSLQSALSDLEDAWEDIDTAYEADDFAPNPGPLCGWCPFAAECPEGIENLKERAAAGRLRKDAPAYHLTQTDAA